MKKEWGTIKTFRSPFDGIKTGDVFTVDGFFEPKKDTRLGRILFKFGINKKLIRYVVK